MRLILLVFGLFFLTRVFGQHDATRHSKRWADSVYQSLSPDERIGQLIVARLSIMDQKPRRVRFLMDSVEKYVQQYNLGGICLFQGDAQTQARYVNRLKQIAKTPILFSIDGEWGVAMRLYDSILPLPRQMMLGATRDEKMVKDYGSVVASQCKRLGIQMNYAPVIDVNNNPNNPVINDRSFGEDKQLVSRLGIAYMNGMQDAGVMACIKHFPGHGDVDVDSHLDLPVIRKSMAALDSLELYPFKQAIEAGSSSAMIAHLSIPAIDDRPNRPTSLSKKNIDTLLRQQLGFTGLAITDGLEMKGVKKFFPDGEAEVEAVIAGNDLLCLPDSIPLVVQKIRQAIDSGRLSWNEIETHVKRILQAKHQYVLPQNDTIALNNLVEDLNRDVPAMRRKVAEKAITLLSDHDRCFFPLKKRRAKRLAFVGVGVGQENAFARMLKAYYGADLFFVRQGFQTNDSLNLFLDSLKGYTKLIVGIHQLNRSPVNRFGMKDETLELIHQLQDSLRSMTFLFGNAYAASYFSAAKNLAICYEDDSIVHQTAFDLLRGKLDYRGKLPVTIQQKFSFGYGITTNMTALPDADPSLVHHLEEQLHQMDEKIELAILKKAMPGCSILAMENGKVFFEKNYGFETYNTNKPVDAGSIYDLASVTKILSTTLAVMKLKETGKIKLSDHIGKHLSELKKNRKAKLTIRQLLMHEAGLTPYLPFYRETLDSSGNPSSDFYSKQPSASFPICVAENMYFSKNGLDLFWKKYLESPLAKPGKYVYSDLGFILLGKIVERVSGKPLDAFVDSIFYRPMGLKRMGYRAANKFPSDWVIPSTTEHGFRNQPLRGWVHDPGAALMGGVAGHAGLFADARDIAAILQLLLQKGVWMDKSYLKPETIQEFTAYQHAESRRGLGFDKPEQHPSADEPYPAKLAGSSVFGHLGFTGTGVWADPEKNRVVVFLSNRVYEENNVFQKMRLRAFVFDQLYEALDNLHP